MGKSEPPSMEEIADRLDRLANEMLEVSVLMNYYGGLSNIASHGIELAGAAHIARGWAKGIREDVHA